MARETGLLVQSVAREHDSPTHSPPPLEASSRQFSVGHIVGPPRSDPMGAAEPPSENQDSLAAAEAAVSTPSARTTNVSAPPPHSSLTATHNLHPSLGGDSKGGRK